MILGRYLGLDPGERRIGIALSDPLGIIAHPLVVVDRRAEDAIARISDLCAEHEVGTIVVGLPVSLSGEEGEAAAKARLFADQVGKATGCEMVFYDERFTTVQAEAALLESGMRRRQRRERVDKVAAAMLLQGFLDSRGRDDT